jgi:hypothetical protein
MDQQCETLLSRIGVPIVEQQRKGTRTNDTPMHHHIAIAIILLSSLPQSRSKRVVVAFNPAVSRDHHRVSPACRETPGLPFPPGNGSVVQVCPLPDPVPNLLGHYHGLRDAFSAPRVGASRPHDVQG